MKKFLAILMVLVLVSGALFAEDPVTPMPTTPIDTAEKTFEINAAMTGVLRHGFTGSELTSFGAVIGGTFSNALSKTVTLSNPLEQGLNAYYSFGTNTRSNVTITAKVTALTLQEAGNAYYIPFTLKLSGGSGSTDGNKEITFAAGSVSGETAIDDAQADIITSKYTAGRYYFSKALSLVFGVDNSDAPAGDYKSTVTLSVVTE